MNKLLIIGYVFFSLILTGLAIWFGVRYPLAPEAVIVPASTPVDWGYAVGPGWQMTPTPEPEQALVAATATPTPAFLQVPDNIAWMIADAARNYYGERVGTLTDAEKDALYRWGATFELGVQVTKRHVLGTSQGDWAYMVFAEGVIVEQGGRYGVISPHGRWHAWDENNPPTTPVR